MTNIIDKLRTGILVMGVLNITPDSFFDGGRYVLISKAIDRAAIMIAEGVSIIDVGGESTRPGSCSISDDEEMSRVIPVITELLKRFDIFISVDTSKASVIRESASLGVHLINDVRSLSEDGSLEAAVQSRLPVCLVHNTMSFPKDMQYNLVYKDILQEIELYFVNRINCCVKAGLSKDKLLIDPGFGFGKNLDENYQLLSNLSYFFRFNVPLLVGMSHKSMIGDLLNCSVSERVIGSIVCAVIAAMQGVKVIRVHDVKETVDAIKIIELVLQCKGEKFT